MSILRPTVGQLLDRAALVSLKIYKGRAAGKDVSHFLREEDEIDAELTRRGHGAGAFSSFQIGLGAIHAAMWPLVERAEAGDESVSAVELHRLNRHRAEVREEIDRMAGEFVGHEKV